MGKNVLLDFRINKNNCQNPNDFVNLAIGQLDIEIIDKKIIHEPGGVLAILILPYGYISINAWESGIATADIYSSHDDVDPDKVADIIIKLFNDQRLLRRSINRGIVALDVDQLINGVIYSNKLMGEKAILKDLEWFLSGMRAAGMQIEEAYNYIRKLNSTK